MKKSLMLFLIAGFASVMPVAAQTGCSGDALQVLGSGGPEVDGRASTSYLLWHEGRARLLIDMGPGSWLRFEEAGANLNDLQAILFTHFHVDHSADLPALVKSSYFTDRDQDLTVYGPTGNQLMPSAEVFVQGMFGEQGVYAYLSDYLDGSDRYQLIAHSLASSGRKHQRVIDENGLTVTAVPVHHGPIPALAWRMDLGEKSIVISGDMNNDFNTLAGLASHADLLIAHHAIPEHTNAIARNLHMPPSVIGEIAAMAKVRQLVLSHRMQRTLGREQESLQQLRKHYAGPVTFADDLQCFNIDD